MPILAIFDQFLTEIARVLETRAGLGGGGGSS
jgi:hypothetical protein